MFIRSRSSLQTLAGLASVGLLFIAAGPLPGQEASSSPAANASYAEREKMLLDRIEALERRLNALETGSKPAGAAQPLSPKSSDRATASTGLSSSSAPQPAATSSNAAGDKDKPSPLAFSDGTTLNFLFDGFYGYNFNHPVGRVNLLRANDPLSNGFTVNQAVAIVECAPDVNEGRRWGYRLDLMFGQQTDILQGSTANETRPQIYRNIFQAYGSYVLPIGSGLQLDFGKFASSLGFENTYTKDQLNYSRSFYYNFLPFYHTGLRATYNVNSKFALQYWLVNGANQTEDFNGFKSQAAIVTFKPNSNISWNINYYNGREQRDVLPLYNPGLPSLPTSPGLSIDPVTFRHDGRFHVIDSYVSFNLGSKWSTALEGDYVINRVAANATPSRVFGGAAYLHRQLTKQFALNGRFEYLADRGGLFSGLTQDLKDATVTAVLEPVSGFQTRLEYRRDFSNRRFFLTNDPSIPAGAQNTLTIGMLWWFGGKGGIW